MNEINEIDLARLAAFIDGEGCITITVRKSNSRMNIKIFITNTDIRLPEWCVGVTGVGNIHMSDSRRDLMRVKPAYRWECTGGAAMDLAKLVYPYLILKKDQADILIRLRKYVTNAYGVAGLPAWVKEQRLSLTNQIRQLNQRGVQ